MYGLVLMREAVDKFVGFVNKFSVDLGNGLFGYVC